jgi:hypothetical protein
MWNLSKGMVAGLAGVGCFVVNTLALFSMWIFYFHPSVLGQAQVQGHPFTGARLLIPVAAVISSACLVIAAIITYKAYHIYPPSPKHAVPATVPPLSESEAKSLMWIYPTQGTATAYLDQPGNLRMHGCAVIHNCSLEQMEARSLQNLKITLGETTTLFSSHRLDIGAEVGPRAFLQYLFTIDLDTQKAERILSRFNGTDSCATVQIFMAGDLVFAYQGKEFRKPVSMQFITEASR